MIATETASVCVDGRDKPGHDGKSGDAQARALAAPREGTQTAAILRLAKEGVSQKQISEQTGSNYYYVACVLAKLRQRGLLEQPDKIWTDEALAALYDAVVVKGMGPAAAAAQLSAAFGRPFNRNMVQQVAFRRGWRAGDVIAAATGLRDIVKKKRAWDDEHLAALREAAVVQKLSGAATAVALSEKFGRLFTRNAVIGMARRLGLSFTAPTGRPRRDSPRAAAARKPRASARARQGAPQTNGCAPKAQCEVEIVEPVALVEWEPLRLTLLELRPGDCRFPLGDPRGESFGFCGAPVEAGKPYCPHCAGVAYDSPADRAEMRRKWRAARGLAAEA
jgi:GcrA cell cycle regulator